MVVLVITAVWVLLAGVAVTSATSDTCFCNPTVVLRGGSGSSSNGVNVTTQVSIEQTRTLFNQVSRDLLNQYENRFRAFLDTLNLEAKPKDCDDIQMLGNTRTGVYTIYPGGQQAVRTRCDMDTASGGWTVIQRRESDTDFYKTWAEYQVGFGNLSGSYWLGNEKIHLITKQGWYKLRIDMVDEENQTRYAEYKVFSVGSKEDKYKLYVSGYDGDAGDSLIAHSGYPFSTKDSDNDIYGANCAALYLGGWWYYKCHISNLNGDYGNKAYAKGLTWRSLTGYYKSLSTVSMKIKRWSSADELLVENTMINISP